MARKITPETNAAPPPDDGADDLDVMHPDRSITVGGKHLVVREYSFNEELDLQRGLAQPVIAKLVEVASTPGEMDLERILDVLQDDRARMYALVAEACTPALQVGGDADARAKNVRKLAAFFASDQISGAQGEGLLMCWWLVNGGFFMRRVTRRLATRRITASVSGGPTSSPTSPPLHVAASTKSGDVSPGGK